MECVRCVMWHYGKCVCNVPLEGPSAEYNYNAISQTHWGADGCAFYCDASSLCSCDGRGLLISLPLLKLHGFRVQPAGKHSQHSYT
ncbi:unnamed protein product [Leuciscus chuanchicus]